ncbi:unnamed protein product [Meganyctiphanes norvegica]|uniref:Uncharacterized protein n=1 Tax=Meganyctiphanes norvegica TaxID=48144 RepID=A0AAV2QMA7_MEGNR
MVEIARVLHAIVILVAVGAYTYYMFVGFHGESFKYAKKNFEELMKKNKHMKADIELWKEEDKNKEILRKQAEELENEAKRLRESVKVDKVAQMELELNLLKEQLAANTGDVRFVNQKLSKKKSRGNKGRGIEIDENLDVNEQARRIKYQLNKLNQALNNKPHRSNGGTIKVSKIDGVHVPEDLLENIQYDTDDSEIEDEPEMEDLMDDFIDEPQMEDLMEDYKSVIESPSVEDFIEEYEDIIAEESKSDRHYLTEEELLTEFQYVEEHEEELEENYEQDTGEFCEMDQTAEACGFG